LREKKGKGERSVISSTPKVLKGLEQKGPQISEKGRAFQYLERKRGKKGPANKPQEKGKKK